MKNYLLLLFLVLYSASFSEELVLKEMNILPKKLADITEEKSKVKKVYIIRDENNKYFLEIFLNNKKGLVRRQIEITEDDYQQLLMDPLSNELAWEKDNDYNYAVYGTTLNTFNFAGNMLEGIDIPEQITGIAVAGAGAGAYIYTLDKANKGYYSKRDYASMQNMGVSAGVTAFLLADAFGANYTIRQKTTAGIGFLTYLKSKGLVEKYDLNIGATTLGLRNQFLGLMFINVLYVEDFISWRKAAGIGAAVSIPLFAAGTIYGKKLQISTGGTAVCDNFSDAAVMAVYQLDVKSPYREVISYGAALVPYYFADKVEDAVYFKENDNIGVKTGELIGFALGASTANLFKMDDKGTFLMGSAGIVGGTIVTMKILEGRPENSKEYKRTSAVKIDLLPVVMSAAKVPGGGEVFRVEF